MEKKKQKTIRTITGKIGEIGFHYKITTKAQHKDVLKDLRSFAKGMKKAVREPNSFIMQKITNLKEETKDLQRQNKEMEKQLRLTKNISFVEAFRNIIREEIHSYKNWEIREIMEKEINLNNHSPFTRIFDERIKNIIATTQINKI